MIGPRQIGRYAKMTRDGTEQGRAFRISGRPDLSELLTSVSSEYQRTKDFKIEPPHGRPDKSELFSSDPVDHDHKKDQETALTEWDQDMPEQIHKEVVTTYDYDLPETEAVFCPVPEATNSEQGSMPVSLTSAVERIESALGNVLHRLGAIEKAMWRSTDFSTRLGMNMEALNKRMERVENFMGAQHALHTTHTAAGETKKIKISQFFPIETVEQLDEIRLKTKEDYFKTALGLYFIKMLREREKNRKLVKIFSKWFGDDILNLYRDDKSLWKSCPILAEIKGAFLSEEDFGDAQFNTYWKTALRRCYDRTSQRCRRISRTKP